MTTANLQADAFAKIRPTKINFYLRYMSSQGFTAHQVLHDTGIRQQQLNDRHTLIDISSYIRIVSNIMHLTKSPTLAFELGQALEPGDLGILGHAFSACQNASEAISLWQKYSQLFFGNLISVQGHSDGFRYWFEFIPRVKLLPHLLQFFMEEKTNVEIALFRRFNNCYVNNRLFSFTYPAPPHATLYEELLETTVKFSASKNLFSLDVNDAHFNKRFPGADSETLQVCTNYLDELTNSVNTRTTLTSQLRFLIRERLPTVSTPGEIATEMRCSTRTLSRNLEKEDTTYQKVLTDVREEMAKSYLATTSLSVSEIARLLGFQDTGSLRRAFTQWTGTSITTFKKNRSGLDTIKAPLILTK